MLKLSKTVLAANLSAAVLLSFSTATMAAVPSYSANIDLLINYLKANQDTTGKIIGFGGETSWTIMGLVAVGIDPSTVENSGNSLLDFLAANPPADSAVTAWQRDLLAITAAGENPFTFGSRNYVAKVESFYDGTQIGSNTAINDDIFGVLALISAGPSANQNIISESVDFIIANQNTDGGWSWQVGGSSDTNDTAVAVQALKAAQNKGFINTGIVDAIASGVAYLLSLQQPDGGWEYQSGFGTDGASTAWVVQAVLGNDSVVENGLNFLVSLQDASGGIQYQAGFGADTFTSSYALIAFGQMAFPIGEFDGTFEEQVPVPDPQPQPQPNPSNNQNNPPGQVPVANNNLGDVLAATLPNTGIPFNLDDSASLTQVPVKTSEVNKLLLAGLIALEAGLVLQLVARCIKRSIVN